MDTKVVIHEVARFLEALPCQVQAWDRKVVEHLSRNSEIFQKFQRGCSNTKWHIYSRIKYEALK